MSEQNRRSSVAIDRYDRRINYLRLSVTDRCNFRCLYCMPSDGIQKFSHDDILRFEDFLNISKAALELGITKIRITGGEPMVRKGLLPFLHQLRQLPGLDQLTLTTNGHFLKDSAWLLRDAGVERINISLDSLKPDRFKTITRCGSLSQVWDGLLEATRIGIPLKLNVVVLRGVNDDEILDFVGLAARYNWSIRFIEYMSDVRGKQQRWWLPTEELYQRISQVYALEPVDTALRSGPATMYRIAGFKGAVGFISALSCPFCSSCNRVRITSTGKMRTCLFFEEEVDLVPVVKSADGRNLKRLMKQGILQKPLSHHLLKDPQSVSCLKMSQVGG